MKPFCFILFGLFCSLFAAKHQKHLTSESASFRFHYPMHLQEWVPKIAEIAENAYEVLGPRYGVKFEKPIDCILDQGLFSNGHAMVQYSQMHIWLADWGIDLRSTHQWIHDVTVHEFAHLVSLRAASRFDPRLLGGVVGVNSDGNQQKEFQLASFYPLLQIPSWFAEGTAQYESKRMGFDNWDTHRKTLLRALVEQDALLSLEEMNGFWSKKSIDFERGPYLQGFSLVLFIDQKWGELAVPNIWKSIGTGNSFESALQAVLKIDGKTLYRQWKSSLEEKWSIAHIDSSSRRIVGFWNGKLQLTQDSAIVGLSNFSSDSWKSKLWILTKDSLEGLEDSTGLWKKEKLLSAQYWKTNKPLWNRGFSLTRSDSTGDLLYVTAQYRDSLDNALAEINLVPGNEKEKRLTKGMWTRDPTWHPEQKEIAFVSLLKESNSFRLHRMLLDSSFNSLELKTYPGPDSLLYWNVYKPKYNAQGTKLAYSIFDGISRSIYIMDLETESTQKIPSLGAIQRDPVWKEGSLCFSSNVNQKFSLYCYDTKTQKIELVQNGEYAVFDALPLDSSWLWVDIDSSGFTLRESKTSSSSEIKAETNKNKLQPMLLSDFALSTKQKYSSIPFQWIVYPTLQISRKAKGFWGQGEQEWIFMPGLVAQIKDPLERNSVFASYAQNWGDGWNLTDSRVASNVSVNWKNTMLPFDFDLRWIRSNVLGQDTLQHSGNSDDPIQVQNLSVSTQALLLFFGDTFLHKGDYWRSVLGYQSANYHFYETFGNIDYNKGFFTGLNSGWKALKSYYRGSALADLGLGFDVGWQYQNMEVFNPKRIKFTSLGIEESFHRTQVHLSNAMLYLGLPLYKDSRIILKSRGQKILYWTGHETLNRFFEPSLSIPGYQLYDGRQSNIKGANTLLHELHFQTPLWLSNYSFGSYMFRGIYGVASAYAGKVWNGSYWKQKQFSAEGWARSIALELRVSQVLWYSRPLEFFVKSIWTLDKEDYKSYQTTNGLPNQWELGLSFSFTNPTFANSISPRRF